MRRLERRTLLGLLAGASLAPTFARSQPGARVQRIGYLFFASLDNPVVQQLLDAFREGLQDLGYIEGRNIILHLRSAEGSLERFPDLATDLVRHDMDLIAAFSNAAIHAARRVTATIPIVSFSFGDPVADGLVSSLARPGGNITGFTLFAPELVPKGLSLLVEAVPKASRIAALWSPGSLTPRTADDMLSKAVAAAQSMGVQLRLVEVGIAEDIDGAFASIRRDGATALLVLPSPLTNTERQRIADYAHKNQLPSLGWNREFAEAGCLLGYGSDIADNWRRGAVYADKILKGANPADLPIQQPTLLRLVINLKTAKALGLTVPPLLLARADEVIE